MFKLKDRLILLNSLSLILVASVIFITGGAVYLLSKDYTVYDKTVDKFQVLNKKIKPGTPIRYVIDYCKLTDVRVELQIELVGPHRVRLIPPEDSAKDTRTSGVTRGCYSYVRSITLPKDTPLGCSYRIVTSTSAPTNFLRDPEEDFFESQEFCVVSEDTELEPDEDPILSNPDSEVEPSPPPAAAPSSSTGSQPTASNNSGSTPAPTSPSSPTSPGCETPAPSGSGGVLERTVEQLNGTVDTVQDDIKNTVDRTRDVVRSIPKIVP